MDSFILFHVKHINSCHFKPEHVYVELIDLPVEFVRLQRPCKLSESDTDPTHLYQLHLRALYWTFTACRLHVNSCSTLQIFKRIYTGACSSSANSLDLEHMYVELRFLAVELAILASTRFQHFSYSRHIDTVSSGRRWSSVTTITSRVIFLYPAMCTENICCFESPTSP